MRTVERKLVTLAELKEIGGAAYDRALSDYRHTLDGESVGASDVVASADALYDALGVTCRPASLGTTKVSIPSLGWNDDDTEELTDYRPYIVRCLANAGYMEEAHKSPTTDGRCKLTGACFDDDLVQSFWGDLPEDGEIDEQAFADAVRGISGRVDRIIEREMEYQSEEDQILEASSANGWEIDADTGEMM